MVENTELTISHVDLGALTDYALVALFSNAICHRITEGTGRSIRDITDAGNNTLYPAYYYVHIQIPEVAPLESFRVWDRVSVGVDVRSFGGMILESRYVLGREGQIRDEAGGWGVEALPSMRAGSLFILDDQREVPKPSTPRSALIAKMPKMTTPPESISRFSELQSNASWLSDFQGRIRSREPIRCHAVVGRDVSRAHSLTAASIVRLMDLAEAALLGAEQQEHPLPESIIDARSLREREMFFLSNSSVGDRALFANVAANLELRAQGPEVEERTQMAALADISFCGELRVAGSDRLIAVSRSRKTLLVPANEKVSALRAIERLGGS